MLQSSVLQVISFYLREGGVAFISPFLLALAIYIVGKLIVLAADTFLPGKVRTSKELEVFCKAVVFLVLLLVIPTFLGGVLLDRITAHPSPSRVIVNSEFLMKMDRAVFAKYLPFWFQQTSNPAKPLFDSLGPFLVSAYAALSLVLGMILIFTLISDYQIFLEIFVASLLSLALSLPFWYIFPALSPLDAYQANILHAPPSQAVQRILNDYRPNQYLREFFDSYLVSLTAQRLHNERFLAVSTIPSMHIAWAFLALYFGIVAWRPFMFVLIPYFSLNVLATMYTLQHYAVDVIAGVLIALIAIVFTRYIIRFRILWEPAPLTVFLQHDLRVFLDTVRGILK